MMPSSSSSDSESEEEKAKLRLALDPSFTLEPTIQKEKNEERKSVRQKVATGWDSGHYQTFKLTVEGQAFLSRKLGEALTESIKFVRRKVKEKEDADKDSESGIYLFSDSKHIVTGKDLAEKSSELNGTNSHRKRKQPQLKRRKLDDEDGSDSENEKLKSVAVTADWVTTKQF